MFLEDSLRALNFVEKNIYNEKGVTFAQLHNANKVINSYYKQATDPNFRNFIKRGVENFLRDDIKRGIENIFAQNKELSADAKALFDTALSDYAKMKNTLKIIDKLKVRDVAVAKNKAFNNILNYIQAQGENGIAKENFEVLARDLDPSLRTEFELGFLQNLLEQNIAKIGNGEVFNSQAFFNKLEGMQHFFTSPQAKEYIQIAKNFHTLFKNDYNIAKALSPATSDKIGSSIATSLAGAVQFQITKMLFENIVRLMPHIPFAKGLNEKIQGTALRYHIKKAFSNAIDVQDFNLELKALEKKNGFNNATKELIQKIKGEVAQGYEKALQQIAKEQTKELGNPLLGTNYPQYYHKPQEAITKLLSEAKDYEARKEAGKLTEAEIEQGAYKGQVAGAFYKEGLGDIDLVWGDSSFGLAHILERRTEQWGEERALRFISHLPEIIQESKIIQGRDGSIELLSPRSTIILAKKDDNHFMITAFRDSGNKSKLKELENSQTFHDESFTSKSDSERNGTDILSQNQQADSTTKPFKQQDISFENFEDFSKYAKLSGIEFESEAQEREAYKHIQSKLKSLEC